MPGAGKRYKVKANEFLFSFSEDEIANLDIVQKSPTAFNVIKDHRSVNAKLVAIDDTGKKLTVEVDGESYAVEIKDELDQMLDVMGFSVSTAKLVKEVKAPMPGMVLEVVVTEGQQINEGEKILILGAMKMENSILVHADATVKRVAVTVGQAVEKGQVLVELE
jgi:biotin carboxyl carrier protein